MQRSRQQLKRAYFIFIIRYLEKHIGFWLLPCRPRKR